MTVAEIFAFAGGIFGEEPTHFAAEIFSLQIEERAMNEVGMITIYPVLHLEFPVAIVAVLMCPCARLELAFRR